MQTQAAAPRLPIPAGRLLPQTGIQLPAGAAVRALKQHAGVAAGIQEPIDLAAIDDPDALERLVSALGQRDPLRLLPLTARPIGVEDLRSVERRGHRRQNTAGSRI